MVGGAAGLNGGVSDQIPSCGTGVAPSPGMLYAVSGVPIPEVSGTVFVTKRCVVVIVPLLLIAMCWTCGWSTKGAVAAAVYHVAGGARFRKSWGRWNEGMISRIGALVPLGISASYERNGLFRSG